MNDKGDFMLTVKELIKKLNPHFNNCNAVYFYDEEDLLFKIAGIGILIAVLHQVCSCIYLPSKELSHQPPTY